MTSKLKVAHILPGMYFGGVETAVFNSFRDLNLELDYEVFFVRGRGVLDVDQKPFAKIRHSYQNP